MPSHHTRTDDHIHLGNVLLTQHEGHNDTVTVPSWLGQYAWMNDMITSLATQIGVTSIGSIPESIGNLTKLQSINLHGKVTGEHS
jgi:hypothetical protein